MAKMLHKRLCVTKMSLSTFVAHSLLLNWLLAVVAQAAF